MRKRIGVIAILQESNTFIAERTSLANFQRDVLLFGEEIRRRFQGAHHEVSGFLAGLDSAGLEAVPIMAARALPSGVMTDECFNAIISSLDAGLERAGPLDGVLVAPHGATVSERVADVDGYWLQRVRDYIGPECPVIGTLDPHANLSPTMVAACDALLPYRTNPHLDQCERGLAAAQLMAETIAGRVRPTQAAAFLPLAINIQCQSPEELPLRESYELAAQFRTMPEILSADICLGFPYADVPEMGAAAIAVTNGEPALAQTVASKLAEFLWAIRDRFCPELLSVDAAMKLVAQHFESNPSSQPVCLLDMGDNVGAGSPADSTLLLQAIERQGVAGAFVSLCDPAAVAQLAEAPIGARVVVDLGGKTDRLHGEPLHDEATLLSRHDGKFRETQPSHAGSGEFDQGPTAIIRTSKGTTVMLTSRRMAPWSLAQLRSCGLDPSSFRVLVAKGVHSPVAAYREVCGEFVRVNTAGSTSADLSTFSYERRRRPMFPFETSAAWEAEPGMHTQEQDRHGT